MIYIGYLKVIPINIDKIRGGFYLALIRLTLIHIYAKTITLIGNL